MNYFVSYKYLTGYPEKLPNVYYPDDYSVISNISIERNEPIYSIKDIREIELSILDSINKELEIENKSEKRVLQVLILNWQRFEEEKKLDYGLTLEEQENGIQ